MKIVTHVLAFALFLPLFASAQFNSGSVFSTYIGQITTFMNNVLVPLVFALAFLTFLWGVFKTFILGGGDEEKQSEGKKLIMYSIAGFVIMVSLWGIVNLVARGFGFDKQNIQQNIPNLPTAR